MGNLDLELKLIEEASQLPLVKLATFETSECLHPSVTAQAVIFPLNELASLSSSLYELCCLQAELISSLVKIGHQRFNVIAGLETKTDCNSPSYEVALFAIPLSPVNQKQHQALSSMASSIIGHSIQHVFEHNLSTSALSDLSEEAKTKIEQISDRYIKKHRGRSIANLKSIQTDAFTFDVLEQISHPKDDSPTLLGKKNFIGFIVCVNSETYSIAIKNENDEKVVIEYDPNQFHSKLCSLHGEERLINISYHANQNSSVSRIINTLEAFKICEISEQKFC